MVSPPRPMSLIDRVVVRLRSGATVESISASEGITVALARLMVEDLERRGLLASAESLCASGFGACGGGDSDQVRLHCSGCPLAPLR